MPSLGVLFDLDSVRFSCEIDVAVVANDRLGLISGLGEAGGLGEGVSTNGGRGVEILARQILGPDGGGLLINIVALRHLLMELIIRLLLSSSPGSVLND